MSCRTAPNMSIASSSGYWMPGRRIISSTAATSIGQRGYSGSERGQATGCPKTRPRECFSKQSRNWRTEWANLIYYATCWLGVAGKRGYLATIMPMQMEFMSWRSMNLLRFFLQNSPTARYDRFTQIFGTGVSDKNPPPVFKSDDQYVLDFLNRLEVTGPSIAAIATHRSHIATSNQRFLRVFPQPKTMRVTNGPGSEPEQLLECIRLAINMVEGGVTLYQQLEQRIQVASPDSIQAARNKLVTLFKLLLKRREALPQGSIEHQAASSVSGALLQALQKSQQGQEHYKLGELQAMEQLLVAREYQRKGQEDMAMNSLEEICRNQGASSKTRLEALRVLCSSGEQQGDATILQSLVSAMGGQQQYEQMLLLSIRKIKDSVGG